MWVQVETVRLSSDACYDVPSVDSASVILVLSGKQSQVSQVSHLIPTPPRPPHFFIGSSVIFVLSGKQ